MPKPETVSNALVALAALHAETIGEVCAERDQLRATVQLMGDTLKQQATAAKDVESAKSNGKPEPRPVAERVPKRHGTIARLFAETMQEDVESVGSMHAGADFTAFGFEYGGEVYECRIAPLKKPPRPPIVSTDPGSPSTSAAPSTGE